MNNKQSYDLDFKDPQLGIPSFHTTKSARYRKDASIYSTDFKIVDATFKYFACFPRDQNLP